MIQRWNEKVKPEDLVYHLGDFSMSMRGLDQIVYGLNGTKVLIPGNHDSCHPAHKANRRGQVTFKDYERVGFSDVALEMIIEIPLKGIPTKVKMCHLPYEPDDKEKVDRRYMDMRPKDEGLLLLHGHVHTAFKFNVEKRMVNVGVDQWNFFPVSVEEIDKLVTENNFPI